MYEIKQSKKIHCGEVITTFIRKDVFSVETEVGTTGYYGGDSSATYLRIEPGKNNPLSINAKVLDSSDAQGIEIYARGDWELESLITSLEFILQGLKDAIKEGEFERR